LLVSFRAGVCAISIPDLCNIGPEPQQQLGQPEDPPMVLEPPVNPTAVTQPKWHLLLGKFCRLL